jgi:hypothetical protein
MPSGVFDVRHELDLATGDLAVVVQIAGAVSALTVGVALLFLAQPAESAG